MGNESDVAAIKMKILMLGDNFIGKTSLFHRFLTGEWLDEPKATIGVDFGIKTVQVDEKFMNIQLWDTAGHVRFNESTKFCIKGSHGLLVVYDVTSELTFDTAQRWLEFVRTEYKHTPVILCGNKADPSLEHKRVISKGRGQNLADSFGVDLVETSAKENVNVDAMFYHLTALAVFSQQENVTQNYCPSPHRSDFRNKTDLPTVKSLPVAKTSCRLT